MCWHLTHKKELTPVFNNMDVHREYDAKWNELDTKSISVKSKKK